MTEPAQVSLDSELYKRIRVRATALGVCIPEYERRIVGHPLAKSP